jgi:hypothetical protein
MKGMIPGIATIFMALGCGGRTFLPSTDIGEASDDTPLSTGSLGSDDATAPTTAEFTLVPLTTDSAGVILGNSVGIVGQWYAWSDDWGMRGPPGVCQTLGDFTKAQCSSISFPPPPNFPLVFPQISPGTFCLTGTAAQVIGKPGMPPDYADIYGIGMGIDLNNSGGGSEKMTYDAPAHNVVGFQFDVVNLPPAEVGSIRVELPTPEANVRGFAYWGELLTSPLAEGGKNERLLFKNVAPFPSGESPPEFKAKDLLSIEFHVASITGNSIPVSELCVSNLQAIVQN